MTTCIKQIIPARPGVVALLYNEKEPIYYEPVLAWGIGIDQSDGERDLDFVGALILDEECGGLSFAADLSNFLGVFREADIGKMKAEWELHARITRELK